MWRLSLKEVFSQKTLSFLFVLNLSFGMSGFLALELFKSAVFSKVSGQSERVLQGEFEISSRFQYPEKMNESLRALEKEWMLESSEEIRLFSMVQSDDGEKLVQLNVIDKSFPLVGDFEMESKLKITKSKAFDHLNEGEAWIYPELRSQIGLDVGDYLRIGDQNIKVTQVIMDDPSLALGGGASFAPRVFLRDSTFRTLDLMKKGTTFRKSRKFVGVADNKKEVVEKFKEVIKPFKEVRLRTSEVASEQNMRLIDYLNDYLGLISLLAFFLSLIGSLFLFYLYLEKQKVDTSIIFCLGMNSNKLIKTKYYSLGSLFLLSIPIITILTLLFYSGIRILLQDSFQFEVEDRFFQFRYLGILVVLFLVSSLALFPIVRRMCQRSVKALFNDGLIKGEKIRLSELLIFLLLGMMIYGLAVYLSNSFKIAAFFILGLLFSLGLFWLLGFILLRFFAVLSKGLWWPIRVIFAEMRSHSMQSILLFVTLGFSLLILNLIPHIRESLVSELQNPEGSRVPAFFLFDIQEEQLEPIKGIIEEKSAQFRKVSPMVRARLIEVNDEPFERESGDDSFQTREGESEARFRNRGFNLSYEFIGTSQDRIVEGNPITGVYDWQSGLPAEVSVETRFAQRLGFQLGDRLLFDIQGVELLAKIVNFRQVKWTEFDPNFFVELQKGVLDEAPKIFLASVLAPKNSVAPIQRELSRTVPNVSVIEVGRLIDKILELTDKIVGAILLMAYLALFVGALVLYSILMTQAMRKIWQYHLFQTLGASYQSLLYLFAFESLILGLVGGLFGYIGALSISYVVVTKIFEFPWRADWMAGFFLLFFLIGLCLLLAFFVSQFVLRSKATEILADN